MATKVGTAAEILTLADLPNPTLTMAQGVFKNHRT